MLSAKTKVSGNNEHIDFRVATEEDRAQVLALLHNYFFADEPLNAYTEPKGHIDRVEEEYIMDYLRHGYSLLVIHRPTDNAVGVYVAGPQGTDESNDLFMKATTCKSKKWAKVLELMGLLQRGAEACKRYKAKKSMYAIALCVQTEMRCQGIGAKLCDMGRELARQCGFELVRADCSSYYASKILEKQGWDCINTIYYKDHVDENNVPIFTTQSPHESCKSYAFRL